MGEEADWIIDQILGGGYCEDGDEESEDYIPHQKFGRARRPRSDYFAEEEAQPEFQQIEVSKVHARTAKAVCISGVVYFDRPYRGMNEFEFLADWLPLSQCIMTGRYARIPQWIIKSRWQQRERAHKTVDIKIPF